jgi:hypothetical protein
MVGSLRRARWPDAGGMSHETMALHNLRLYP